MLLERPQDAARALDGRSGVAVEVTERAGARARERPRGKHGQPPSGYAELHAWSNFSFLRAAAHPEDLAERAAAIGLRALALTDRDGLYGTVRLCRAARAAGLQGIVGAELSLEGGGSLVLLARTRAGYANLCRAISTAQLRGSKGDARLRWDDLDGRANDLIALSGWPPPEDAQACAERLRALFGECAYLELQHHLRPEDAALVRRTVALARRLRMPYVATNGVRYAVREDRQLCDVLTCVREKTTLAAAGTRLEANAEAHLKDAAAMYRLFAPYPEALRATLEIAEACTFSLDRLEGQFPSFPVPEAFESAQIYLRHLVFHGARERYGSPLPRDVERQIDYELGIIAKFDLAGYFLVVWDIVQAAHRLDVLCQGRGSAANSAVCYCLGITAVDPIRSGLLFERFLSEERAEVPDIDIDFAHQDRERVIQYAYERYGRAHAAMVAEVITYRARSAIRDVGKVLGLSLAQVGAIAKEYDARESLATGEQGEGYPWRPDADGGETGNARERDERHSRRGDVNSRRSRDGESREEVQRGFSQDVKTGAAPGGGVPRLALDRSHVPIGGDIGELLFELCKRIEKYPRHLGIHSGGMLLTRDPLIEVAPVEWATMAQRSVVQWDKDDLADLGLVKIDLLGLGMLSLLRDAFAMHNRMHPEHPLALRTVPPEDAQTYEMLCRADSVGVFQVESRAQMAMLPRLRPRCFYDLVMQVAIIRPGPIQGEMVHPFLRRRNGQEPVTYPHPKLQPVLERTLGVPLFQEQGMRLAIVAAGFTAGQADQLRRAMGNKRSRERMAELYPKLIEGMACNGIDREAAERLFQMLQGFADYGFPESHAASFALLVYASAYLKRHHPAIFTAALLNAQPMGFYSTSTVVNDAKRHGITVRPPRVGASAWWSNAVAGGVVQLGYHLVRAIGGRQRERIETALAEGRPFASLVDFARRTGLPRAALESLASVGAFEPWYRDRRRALWEVAALIEREGRGDLGRLMEIEEGATPLVPPSAPEETALDFWGLGLTTRRHPISYVRGLLQRRRVASAAALARLRDGVRTRVGGLVITRQRPGTAKGFVFLTLEDETGVVNVVLKPKIYERFRRVARQSEALIVDGVLQSEQGVIHVIATELAPLDLEGLTRGTRSHDFH
ncbi:PHP domain-containing protein [bacterium]|nr:MAG: PHP domain-containing protein [bacterium]